MRGPAHRRLRLRPSRRLFAALATAVAAALVSLLTMLPAPAATPQAAQDDVVGNATHFDGANRIRANVDTHYLSGHRVPPT